jgi:hypothetical protein
VLAGGCEGLPLAVDQLEVGGFISLRRRGLHIRTAGQLLDDVRNRRRRESSPIGPRESSAIGPRESS